LVDSRAWDEDDQPLDAPYGAHPMGQIMFSGGRMLAALCKGDADAGPGGRGFSSYGGPYTFDGTTLETSVDVASDPTRIGGHQVRSVVMAGKQMILRPPMRHYSGPGTRQRREVVWERVWQPAATTEPQRLSAAS
jgi:hypothetical protein